MPNHCCGSSHEPPDPACRDYLEGRNGRCVYCDHAEECHPGPGATCDIGSDEPRPFDQPDDTDPNNPVDVSIDAWREIMSDPDYEDNEP